MFVIKNSRVDGGDLVMGERYIMKYCVLRCVLPVLFVLPGIALAKENVTGEHLKNNDVVVMKEGDIQVTRQDIEGVFADMSPGQRTKVLANPDAISKLVVDMLVLQKQAAAAEKKQLADNAQVQWKLRLERQKVLSGALLDKWKLDYSASHNVTALAEEYYQAHPNKFIEPEKLKAAHILLKVKQDGSDEAEQRVKAEKLLAKLKNGLDFEEAAKEFSDDGSSDRGGALGWFGRGRMVKPFEEAAFALTAVGELSGVVRSDFGYHIIKLLERKPQSQKSFDEVRDELIKQRLAKLQEKDLRDFLADFEPSEEAVLYVPVLDEITADLKAR